MGFEGTVPITYLHRVWFYCTVLDVMGTGTVTARGKICWLDLPPEQTETVLFCVQGLPEEFHSAIAADKEHVDLLIVIGSSLKVKTTMFLRKKSFSLVWIQLLPSKLF
jgi:hypothetical protein